MTLGYWMFPLIPSPKPANSCQGFLRKGLLEEFFEDYTPTPSHWSQSTASGVKL